MRRSFCLCLDFCGILDYNKVKYYYLIKPFNICCVKFRIAALSSSESVRIPASSALLCEIFR